MRIAVAGEGGTGKRTISATMARPFAQRGYRVNALDDDPNPNLANALGLTASQVEQLRGIAREDILQALIEYRPSAPTVRAIAGVAIVSPWEHPA